MTDITAAERRRMALESRRRGAAAQHAQRVKGPRVDAYHRRRDIRAELRRAMRLLSRPGVDWDSAAGWLYRAEMEARRLACDCVRQGVEEDESGY